MEERDFGQVGEGEVLMGEMESMERTNVENMYDGDCQRSELLPRSLM